MVEGRKALEGYKMTEAGVIPEDWSCNSLRDFIYISSGESPSKFRFSNLGIPYFKVEQLNNTSKYQRETPYRILSDKYVPKGSIIFPKRGAAIFLNKIRILNQNSYMDTNLMTLTVNSDQLYNEFLFYLLDSKGLWRIADTTSVPQINNKHILPIIFQNPPLPEQKAIAEALSDTDNLIQSIENLIDKKRKIKQGAMQQLLTGKKRLHEFDGEWEVRELGNYLKICHGKSQHLVESPSGKYPILATGGQIGWSEKYLYDKPSVLIGRKGTIDKPQYIQEPFWTIDTLFYSEIYNNAEAKYLYYLFDTIDWYSYNEASGVPSLNSRTIEQINVKMPPLNEQKAIAKILSDMDTEIEALEEKLEKVKTIKQGMMQELLTGRIRLI